MAHTYVSTLIHSVFSTKNRQKYVTADLQERLWPFLGGIARSNSFKALAIGGTEDHIHLLLSLPADLQLCRAIQLLKGGSSRWIHEIRPDLQGFSWQEGYAAFSVATSGVDRTIQYIRSQAEHHEKQSFEDEFISFLKANAVQYDPRYVFG